MVKYGYLSNRMGYDSQAVGRHFVACPRIVPARLFVGDYQHLPSKHSQTINTRRNAAMSGSARGVHGERALVRCRR